MCFAWVGFFLVGGFVLFDFFFPFNYTPYRNLCHKPQEVSQRYKILTSPWSFTRMTLQVFICTDQRQQ